MMPQKVCGKSIFFLKPGLKCVYRISLDNGPSRRKTKHALAHQSIRVTGKKKVNILMFGATYVHLTLVLIRGHTRSSLGTTARDKKNGPR